jgi:hypothetical protein
MPMYFMQFDPLSPWLDGSVDDIRIYSGALSPAAIATIANADGYLLPPQNVSAATGAGSVDLAWDLVLDATGYDVYRDTNSSFNSSEKLNVSPLTGNAYSDTSGTSGITYYYKVIARNSSVISDFSAIATATMP